MLRQKTAVLELRLVRAVVVRERQRGTATREMLERASALVKHAAIKIEAEADPELLALLECVRQEVVSRREG